MVVIRNGWGSQSLNLWTIGLWCRTASGSIAWGMLLIIARQSLYDRELNFLLLVLDCRLSGAQVLKLPLISLEGFSVRVQKLLQGADELGTSFNTLRDSPFCVCKRFEQPIEAGRVNRGCREGA